MDPQAPATAPTTPSEGAPNAPAGDTGANTPTTPASTEDKGFDIASLPKEAWDAIFQHDRFKQLNEKAKQAETIIKEKAAAEEAALKEQGKWQDIAEKREAEISTWKQNSIVAEIKAYAARLGAVDLNDVAALADKAAVTIDDNGVITGAEEAVKSLLENKPHLFNTSTNQPPRVGAGTNPGNANNQGIPKFTHSQIKDPAFFAAHEKDILAAIKAGTVVDDLAA